MKIDLHVHTKKCKKGDTEKRNVSETLFKEKIIMSEVSVIGITNHNHFDYTQYIKFKEIVSDVCDVWPGVELDARQLDSNTGHVIVIVNPLKAKEFSIKLDELVGLQSCDDFYINIDTLAEAFSEYDPIFIPHIFKPKSLGQQDMELLESKVLKKSRLIKEPANIASIGVLNSYNQKCLLGSDVQNWDEYEKCTFSELKYEFSGYENFLKLLDKDQPFVSSLLESKFENKVTVYGDSKNLKYPYTIEYYNDVNIIFGDKGSGKTECLLSLKNYFVKNSIPSLFFPGDDKENWFSKLLATDISKYSYSDLNISKNYSNEFGYLKNYIDATPVSFRDYFACCEHKTKNENAKKIKICLMKKVNNSLSGILEVLKNDFKSIKLFINNLKNMHVYKDNSKKYKNLLDELNNLYDDAYSLYKNKWIDYYSDYFLDFSIDSINTSISECIGTPINPTSTGFFDFATKRIGLKLIIDDIKKILSLPSFIIANDFIGNVGDKGKGNVIESIGLVNQEIIDKIDSKWLNGKKNKYLSFLNKLNDLERSVFKINLMDNAAEIKTLILESSIQDINYFLYSIKIFTLNGIEYRPSKGEKYILSLQYDLLAQKDNYSVFLVDEPEQGLGNEYIEKNIVPLIKDIAKSGKTIIIATHNANIAVRTFPAFSILKIADNGIYRTYKGSMFTNKLVNIDDSADFKLWNIESEKHLEGGKEAFEERGFYYAENN